jgi:hypothetical protein
VIAVFLELGMPDTVLLRIALRSWVAFAEETLVSRALDDDGMPPPRSSPFSSAARRRWQPRWIARSLP